MVKFAWTSHWIKHACQVYLIVRSGLHTMQQRYKTDKQFSPSIAIRYAC